MKNDRIKFFVIVQYVFFHNEFYSLLLCKVPFVSSSLKPKQWFYSQHELKDFNPTATTF